MNLWRMKLRAGNHGEDMLGPCRERGVAIITYAPIANTDLTNLAKNELDPAVKGAARSSIRRFAWDIVGGDVIYVGDSVSREILARGFVLGEVGERAYRYNADDAIRETKNSNDPWKHEVPVEWDEDFVRFEYKDPAPQHTVYLLRTGRDTSTGSGHDVNDDQVPEDPGPLLNDSAYIRETEASIQNVERLHASLSNRFRVWIKENFGLNAIQEKHSVDLHFNAPAGSHLAELKICYGANTKHAIREALGQIFEYNHYPPRAKADFWWLVLDHEPSDSDLGYVQVLRELYGIPLTVSWPLGGGFECFPSSVELVE